MANITPAQVKQIVDTDLADYQINGWCEAAHLIVQSKSDQIEGQALQDNVELYLCAHFIAMLGGEGDTLSSEQLDGFRRTYTSKAKLQELINSTVQGNTANMLAGGCLSDADKPVARVVFL